MHQPGLHRAGRYRQTTFVGTLLIAASTSVPEFVVSVSALRMGAVDMAISTLLGSNLFDVLVIAIDDIAYGKGPLLSSVSAVPAQVRREAGRREGMLGTSLRQFPVKTERANALPRIVVLGWEVERGCELDRADRLLGVATGLGTVGVGDAFLAHDLRRSCKAAITIEAPRKDRHEQFRIGALRRGPMRLEFA